MTRRELHDRARALRESVVTIDIEDVAALAVALAEALTLLDYATRLRVPDDS